MGSGKKSLPMYAFEDSGVMYKAHKNFNNVTSTLHCNHSIGLKTHLPGVFVNCRIIPVHYECSEGTPFMDRII